MATSSTFDTSNQYVKYNITVNVNSQSISNNTSDITVTVRFWRSNQGYETYGTGNVYCGINGTSYSQSVSPSQKITSSGIDLFSRTVTINHNTDGTKTIWVSAYISLDTPLSSSDQRFNVTLPTIPRASSVSGGSGNIGGTTTISINRASSSFTHSLYWQQGSSGWNTIATNVGTNYAWTIPTSFYARIPNSNSGTGTIWCETYSGGTYIGNSSTSFTFNVVNSNPVFNSSQLTYQDINSVVTAITNNDQLIVRNQSNLQITFGTATAQNSATISKYQTIFNGVKTDRTSSGTYSYGVINSAQNLILQVKAIDSRGNSTTISKTVTILDWGLPIIIANASRVNNYENQTNLLANVQISSVNGLNLLQQLQYRVKKTSDTSWNSWIDFQNNTETPINLDNLFAWDLQIQAVDKFSSSTHNLAIPKGMPIMFFDTQKLSVGVNCFPEKSSSLEVNGKTIFDMIYPIGSIYMSVSSADPSTLFGGTWVQWCQGRVPVGVYANETAFNAPDKMGGSLTHYHDWRIGMHWYYGDACGEGNGNGTGAYVYTDDRYDGWARSLSSLSVLVNNNNTTATKTISASGKYSQGNTSSTNTFPRYTTCYMWKRTA